MKYLTLLPLFLLLGCGGGSDTPPAEPVDSVTKEQLGQQLFFDANLSFNRTQSCATCHNPDHAFTDNRDNITNRAVSLGDDNVSLGDRNTPTAMYGVFTPDFHFNENGEPVGGQFLDGREKDLKGQAGGPPVNPVEMGMPDKASVVDRLMENPDYVTAFKTLYGDTIFDDVNATYLAMTESIAKFEKTDEFAPFESKYDRFVQCKDDGNRTAQCYEAGEWSLQEQLGLELFFSEANTNCAVCHQLKTQSEVAGETFSNYEYHNIGVPGNEKLLGENPDLGHDFIDHGLLRQDSIDDPAHDGKFKVPTLRNVAVTAPYMHNGVFKDLRTVIEFYDHFVPQSTHLTNPETGEPWKSAEVNATVNLEDLTDAPPLTDSKIDALVAFLKTLTDKRYEHLIQK